MSDSLRLGGHTIEITHGNRIVFPEDGITKREMVEHYLRVAPFALPHLRGRPVSMQRVRDGIYGQVFFQKEVPRHFPQWIHRVTVPKAGGAVTHVICDNAASLVYIANQGCITPHVWLSRVGALERPDRLIIDLDPGNGGVTDARFAARLAREVLVAAGLVPYIMATGSRGYHLVVPIKALVDFDTVRAISTGLARLIAAEAPDRLTSEFYKKKRHGRLFLDCNRNAWAQTAVPVYSIRPKPGAPVAVPIDWDELDDIAPAAFNVRSLPARLSAVPDPWKGFARHARGLEKALRLASGHD